MYKIIKETDNFVEGVGFLEDVFEDIAEKQNKKLHFKVEKNKNKNRNEVVITITEPNGKRKRRR